MSHARTLAAFALVVAGFAALAAILTSGTHADAAQTTSPAPHAAATVLPAVPGYDAADPFLADLLGPAADLTEGWAAELLLAADRVCEGMTAGVPLTVIEPTLAAELGFTGPEAHEFARLAAWTHCSNTSTRT